MTIAKKLENIKAASDNKLVDCVIIDALEQGDDAQSWLEDVRQCGCSSGLVSGLIYYTDTEKFFDNYQSEIEDAFFEYSKEIGQQPVIPEGNIKNWFAWFAYEHAVNEVLNSLENFSESELEEEE